MRGTKTWPCEGGHRNARFIHWPKDRGGASNEAILARFDCDLSLDADYPILKRNNLRFDLATYFQKGVALPQNMMKLILHEQLKVDRYTLPGNR